MRISGYNQRKPSPNTSNAIDGNVDAPPNSLTDAVYEDQASDAEDECQCQAMNGLACNNCGLPLQEQDPKVIGDAGVYCSMNCKNIKEKG